MYDSTTGWMVGQIWEAEDAVEQIEAFLNWLRRLGHVRAVEEQQLQLEPILMPTDDGADPRQWPQGGLAEVVAFWRKLYVDDDGLLRVAA